MLATYTKIKQHHAVPLTATSQSQLNAGLSTYDSCHGLSHEKGKLYKPPSSSRKLFLFSPSPKQKKTITSSRARAETGNFSHLDSTISHYLCQEMASNDTIPLMGGIAPTVSFLFPLFLFSLVLLVVLPPQFLINAKRVEEARSLLPALTTCFSLSTE